MMWLSRKKGTGPACAFLLVFPALCAAQTASNARAAGLTLAEPVVSQFEDGPTVGSLRVVAGETVYFRYGATGYRTSDSGRVQLTGHIQVFDSRGVPVMPRDEVVIATSLRDEDKNWRPKLHFQFQVPPIAPAGTYRVKYEATDDQTHQTAASETTFVVDGRTVPAADSITVRNLNFYRGPDDEAPLRLAAYHPGDAVWVKFDITGYRHGEQNAIDVTYDVSVTNAEDKQIFSQPDAATEKSQAFYAQPWVPGIFSLTLQTTMNPGVYRVSITARDGVGNKSVTAAVPFEVRR